jgi:hypothetical protein
LRVGIPSIANCPMDGAPTFVLIFTMFDFRI